MYFSEYIFFTSGYWTVLFVQQITYLYVVHAIYFAIRNLREYFSDTLQNPSTLRARDLMCESFMVSRSRVFHSWCNVTVLEYFTFWDAYFYIINYINPTRSHPLVLCMWSVFDTSETVFFIKACIQSECMTHTNIYELFTIFFHRCLGIFSWICTISMYMYS